MSLMDLGMIKVQEFSSPNHLLQRHKNTSEGTARECFAYSTMWLVALSVNILGSFHCTFVSDALTIHKTPYSSL